MVELKLAVAREEGSAARAGHCRGEQVQIERLMPGLYGVCLPLGDETTHFCVIKDDFDLNLLGYNQANDMSVLLLHEVDLAHLQSLGIDVDTRRFERKESLPEWYFLPFVWHDEASLAAALRAIVHARPS